MLGSERHGDASTPARSPAPERPTRIRIAAFALAAAVVGAALLADHGVRAWTDRRVAAELAAVRDGHAAWLRVGSHDVAERERLSLPEAARRALHVSDPPGLRTRYEPSRAAPAVRESPLHAGGPGEVYAFDDHARVLTSARTTSAVKARAYSQARQGAVVLRPHANERGVAVVGAYVFLPELALGLAVERDYDAMYAGRWWLELAIGLGALVTTAGLLAIGSGRLSLGQAHTALTSAATYGPYTLGRKLGEGGMGVVYQASHQRLCRPTAIKVLRSADSDAALRAEAMRRFEREVQLTSQLTHPNTITIYDYGQTDDGTFYYAMEYVAGVDLERMVRLDGPLPAARIIHLALQMCGSLAEAHGLGLIHRDIKPANILVCERGGIPDTIKVLDFGLVKSVHGPAMSGSNVLVGTPLYMAPEISRSPGAAGTRSDIYSLGAVMHWLATAMTVQEAALLSVNLRIAAPSAVDIRAPGDPYAQLPLDLERVIMRCVDSDPYERPSSALELASELMRCRDAGRWSTADAKAYWAERGSQLNALLARPAPANARTVAGT